MGCPDKAILSPLLKRSAVSTIRGPQGPQGVKREILMTEPEVPSLSDCPQQWNLGGVTSLPSATIYLRVDSP